MKCIHSRKVNKSMHGRPAVNNLTWEKIGGRKRPGGGGGAFRGEGRE